MHPVTSLLFPSVFFSFSLFAQPESTFCPRVRSEKKQASSEKFFIFSREQAAKIWKKVLLLYGLLTPLHSTFLFNWHGSWPILCTGCRVLHFCFSLMFCPCKNLLSPTLILHSFPVCLSSVFVSGALAYSFLPYLAISVTTFLWPGLPEGRRKERF